MLSQIEPNNFEEASKDKSWIDAMNDELDQIEKYKTWELTPRPVRKNVIGTNGYSKIRLMNRVKLLEIKPDSCVRVTHK